MSFQTKVTPFSSKYTSIIFSVNKRTYIVNTFHQDNNGPPEGLMIDRAPLNLNLTDLLLLDRLNHQGRNILPRRGFDAL